MGGNEQLSLAADGGALQVAGLIGDADVISYTGDAGHVQRNAVTVFSGENCTQLTWSCNTMEAKTMAEVPALSDSGGINAKSLRQYMNQSTNPKMLCSYQDRSIVVVHFLNIYHQPGEKS